MWAPAPSGRPEAVGHAPAGRLPSVVFAALIVATIGGVFAAQRLKHTPTAVQGLSVARSFRPAIGPEPISFRTGHPGAVTVSIVSSTGETVATLVRRLPWQPYRRLCLAWNGRRGSGRSVMAGRQPLLHALGRCQEAPVLSEPKGALAPAGEYRVRVSLAGHGRSVLSPASFSLERALAGAP